MKNAGRTARFSFRLVAAGAGALGLVLLLSAGAAQWAPGGGPVVTRRAVGPAKLLRRKREAEVDPRLTRYGQRALHRLA
jgi:hypothetical protein